MLARCSSVAGPMVMMVLSGGILAAHAQYGGGTGTAGDPYLIYTPAQMNAIGASPADLDCHFKLMADIDLSAYAGTEFNIIGIDWHNRFTGVFDGNGHAISNFTYSATGRDHVGLFGYVHDRGTEIRNLGLIHAHVTVSGGSEIGCLVGYLKDGTVTNCYVGEGNVSGDSEVGGLIGENFNGAVTNCHSTGAVTATGDNVGGLVGSSLAGVIVNCYATGTVVGNDRVGGLAGRSSEAVADCYSSAVVVGNERTGGLIGYGGGSVTGGFWDIETSGQTTSAGGEGRTTAQMQDPNTFIAAGWDFFGPSDGPSDLWTVDSDTGYPILWWDVPEEELPGLPRFSGGSGTSEDPYLVASAEELNRIGHNPRLMASHFRLINDIDLAGIEFFAISSEVFPFTGDFDGNNKTISNFTRALDEGDNVGFFSYAAGANITIRNLTLIDSNVDVEAGKQIGSLVGQLIEGTVANCRVQGGRVCGTYYVGGLVGLNRGRIENCFADATVTAEYTVGGLVGSNFNTIASCHATGTVSGQKYSVGGLAGAALGGVVRNCCAGCAVTGDDHAGGLIGFVQGAFVVNCYVEGGSVSGNSQVGGLVGRLNTGSIKACYSSCLVSHPSHRGGLVGSIMLGSVTSSFWNVETSGQAASAAGMGTGKTTAEMADPNTFIRAGWDFFGPANGPSDVWTLDPNTNHPILWWQVPEEQWPELPRFSGGTGTPEDPYLIDSAEQLGSIGHNPRLMESCFKLVTDIDLGGTESFPIGGVAAPFAAIFDGNDGTISNLAIVASDTSYVGTFGYVDGQTAQIKNLRLLEPSIDAAEGRYGDYVGALVGYFGRGTLLNCHVEGGSVSGDGSVGGLAGFAVFAIVRNCSATDTVVGDIWTGGLLGECLLATVTDCSATGAVTGSGWSTGGLIGEAAHAVMRNCHATGVVTGDAGTGGLAGEAYDSSIAHCYATGDVAGKGDTGGLVGHNGRMLTDCHATGDVSGRHAVGGLIGDNGGVVTDCYSTGAVAGDSSVGGLVGDCWSGTLDYSHANGTVSGSKNVGGLVGRNRSLTITSCYATGAVSGQDNAGGLVGYNTRGSTIVSSQASGTVSGEINVGGLVGYNDEGSETTNCYSAGSVLGQENVGGLVGRNGELIDVDEFYGEFPGFIVNCYSTGHVSGQTQAGGLVGLHALGSVTASFWNKETSNLTTSDGGEGRTTVAMHSIDTYLGAGWDFVEETANGTDDIWWILEGQDYPRLWWEAVEE